MGTLKTKWGPNGDPKSEKGPHGDPGPQMGTHVGAVQLKKKGTTSHIGVGHFSRAPQECNLLPPDILVGPDWGEHCAADHPVES